MAPSLRRACRRQCARHCKLAGAACLRLPHSKSFFRHSKRRDMFWNACQNRLRFALKTHCRPASAAPARPASSCAGSRVTSKMTASEPAGLPCAYGASCQLPATSCRRQRLLNRKACVPAERASQRAFIRCRRTGWTAGKAGPHSVERTAIARYRRQILRCKATSSHRDLACIDFRHGISLPITVVKWNMG